MTTETLKRAGWFLTFILAQVIVLGHIHLFGVATPLFYIYFILQLPNDCPKWASLLWGFFMGLIIDIFSNTPGLAAASLTFLAAIQPYYIQLFISNNMAADFKPSIKNMGVLKYSYYCIPLVFIYCLLFFTLEQFGFFHIVHWILCIVCSTLITLALIFTFEIAKKV